MTRRAWLHVQVSRDWLLDQARGFWTVCKRIINQADRHNIPFLASALTFDALLAAIPFLLLLLVALTHAAQLVAQSEAQDLHTLFQRFLPPGSDAAGSGAFAVIANFLTRFAEKRGTVSLYAVPAFIWFATRLFGSIRTGISLVYDAPRKPQHFVIAYLTGKVRDAMMVVLMVALLVASAMLGSGLRIMDKLSRTLVEEWPRVEFFVTGIGNLLTQVTAFAISVSLFYVVYRHASPRRLPRPACLVGSVFTASLFEVAKRLYAWYLQNTATVSRFSLDASTGALILFILWLYYTMLVFLLGAVVAETWDLHRRQRGSKAVVAAGS
ncbi:MAG TPA: YihY/virulence factor BrkB family protein [Gemmatimonadales bacterium]|nr:YihY/virulence factor BrkB family protein [Gemmatimonadales bacterium]